MPAKKRKGKKSQTERGSAPAILRAAFDEFVVHGFSGARVDRIARRAKVNKALIYYHFQSKEHLYQVAVQRAVGNELDELRGIANEADSLQTMLSKISAVHAKLMWERPGLRKILLRELASPTTDFIQQMARCFTQTGVPAQIRRQIDLGQDSGTIKKMDTRQAMAAFVSMSLGFYLLEPMVRETLQIDDPDAFVKERPTLVPDIFLNGILTR